MFLRCILSFNLVFDGVKIWNGNERKKKTHKKRTYKAVSDDTKPLTWTPNSYKNPKSSLPMNVVKDVVLLIGQGRILCGP